MDSFFGIGIFELFVIAVIALVVLGPERLPGAMRTVAGYFRQIRQVSNEFTSQFSEEIKMLEEMNPRRMINDVLDPSKTPTPSSSPPKPATPKPATTQPPVSSNTGNSTPAVAAGAKTLSSLSNEEKTMLPSAGGTVPQGTASNETTDETLLPGESKPAADVKDSAEVATPTPPSANGTAPRTDKLAERKAAASAEE